MTSPHEFPSIVFFDIDGTLLNERNQIPVSAVDAIRSLRKNGHLAFINTGRSRVGIYPHILEIQFDGIIAACGTYIEYHNQQLMNKTIDSEFLIELFQVFQNNKIHAFLEGTEHVYFESLKPHSNLSYYVRHFSEFPGIIQDWHQHPVVANKICIMHSPESQYEHAFKILERQFTIINHQPEPLIEIIQNGFSKATGMHYILEHLGVPRDRTYAFGDSLNDIEMLSYANIGIAMGGSRKRVLLASDHVTRSASDNGIAEALKHFGLI